MRVRYAQKGQRDRGDRMNSKFVRDPNTLLWHACPVMWEKAGGSAAYNQLDVEACFLEIVPIKWRPAILRLHQGHLEAMKLPPPDAVFTVLWFGGHFL